MKTKEKLIKLPLDQWQTRCHLELEATAKVPVHQMWWGCSSCWRVPCSRAEQSPSSVHSGLYSFCLFCNPFIKQSVAYKKSM